MRLIWLVVTAILVAGSASAQQDMNLPVSLDKIKEGLEQTPTLRLRGLDDVPTFKVEIHERQKPFALEEMLKSADLKPGPIPAGGLYAYETQRQLWHTADNPLRQPYAAFNQPQLLTILIENLVGKYLAGKAVDAVTSAERAHAEAQARVEVHNAVAEYCAAQPYGGRGIEICSSTIQ